MLSLSSDTALPPRRRRNDDQLLYFMLKPPHARALEIDRQRRALGLDGRYPLDRFHLTLQPFGDIRAIAPSELERILQAAASLLVEPFPIELHRLRDNALIGRDTRALRDFRRRLVRRLAALGVFLPDYDFKPHVSLAYGAWQKRNIPIEPVHWRVEELLLINSIHGHGHEMVDRWSFDRQGSFGF